MVVYQKWQISDMETVNTCVEGQQHRHQKLPFLMPLLHFPQPLSHLFIASCLHLIISEFGFGFLWWSFVISQRTGTRKRNCHSCYHLLRLCIVFSTVIFSFHNLELGYLYSTFFHVYLALGYLALGYLYSIFFNVYLAWWTYLKVSKIVGEYRGPICLEPPIITFHLKCDFWRPNVGHFPIYIFWIFLSPFLKCKTVKKMKCNAEAHFWTVQK